MTAVTVRSRRARPTGGRGPARVPFVLGGLAFLVAVAGSWAPAMWADELATAATITSVDTLWQTLRERDAVFLPYYLLMYGWSRLGTADWWLRVPSAAGLALATALLADLARRLADAWYGETRLGARAGVIAGAALLVLPAMSRFAQEVRPYSLAVAAAVFSFWALHRALATGRWRPYVLAVALLPCTHLFAVLVLPAHLIISRRCLRWMALGSPPALAIAALSASQLGQVSWLGRPGWESFVFVRSTITAWLPEPEPGDLPALALGWLLAGTGLAAAVLLLRRPENAATGSRPPRIRPRRASTSVTAAPPPVERSPDRTEGTPSPTEQPSDATEGAPSPERPPDTADSRPWPRAFVAGAVVWGVLPTVALYAVSHLVTPVYNSRYVLVAAPAFALLVGLALARARRPVLITALAVALALAVPQQVRLRTEVGHQFAYRTAAEIVAAVHRPGDLIVYAVPWAREGLTRYANLPRELGPTVTLGDRVWLIRDETDRALRPGTRWPSRYGLPETAVPKVSLLLQERFTTQRLWHLRGVTVLLLARSPSPR